MKSENPAAAALARTYPGSPCLYCSHECQGKGNWGMTSTRYAESTGLDPHNVSSHEIWVFWSVRLLQYGLIRQFSPRQPMTLISAISYV